MTNINLSDEEINVVINGLTYLLFINKKHPNTVTMSPVSKEWYTKVMDKFQNIKYKECE